MIYQWLLLFVFMILGDLFDMLLPMLAIYQEYVRNHHYSLQVLTECKQSPSFAALLTRLENKTACGGRSLETFLTYPMHQVCYSISKTYNCNINFKCLCEYYISVIHIIYILLISIFYKKHFCYNKYNISVFNNICYNGFKL